MSSDPITRLNAALEGRYRIESELGEGGMATVYLADDLKHERKVALKVLKRELAAVVGAERFLAEIKTTANLQHPHILPLFDSGEADSFLFYVMPYVDGETLRERIDRDKQLPVDEAVRIATGVANALQTAHEHGTIHRDIKPANVLLSRGEPLVADFGIALAVGAAGGNRLTETGLSLGTPYYMSPEQATGDQTVGPPSDTYALAAMLYEMLVGEPPYTGSTAQAVLGKIIQGAPVSATEIRNAVPIHVDAAIRKALEKLPADRFAGVQDFAKALADPGFRYGEATTAGAGVGAGRWKQAAIALGVLALASTAIAGWSLSRPDPPQPVARFISPFVEGQAPTGAMELSADGSMLVYVGPADSGEGQQLWVRRWSELQATPIPGTEGPLITSIALSPDEREVALAHVGPDPLLRVASLEGGPGRTLVEGVNVYEWTVDGFVYINAQEGLARMPAAGGRPEGVEVLTELTDDDMLHWGLDVLPAGTTGVFTITRGSFDDFEYEIWVLDLESGERRFLTKGGWPRYATSGHLLYATFEGVLFAAPFDAATAELTGPGVPIVEGLWVDPNLGDAYFSTSESGALAYIEGTGLRGNSLSLEFAWVTRSGEPTRVDPDHSFGMSLEMADVLGSGLESSDFIPFHHSELKLSPDETRVAFTSLVDGNQDVRIKLLPDGPVERITFGAERDANPFWSPDGQSVFYFSGPRGDRDLWSRSTDGSGEPVLVLDDERGFAEGVWSPDGVWLVLRTEAAAEQGLAGRDIVGFRPGIDTAPVPLVVSEEFRVGGPALSPDGRWLAYDSNETGDLEVFVRPFPDVGASRVRVSIDGGAWPRWTKGGRELVFIDMEGSTMVAAQFDPLSGQVGAREALPEILTMAGVSYDASSDGERFLMVAPAGLFDPEQSATPILVLNWFEELKARVPN